MSTCPACYREQGAGLLCSACCAILEYELSEVPAIVGELDVTLSRQGRIGAGGHGGLASEKTPIHPGAMDPVWVLGNVLTTWARDVTGDRPGWPTESGRDPAIVAAHILLSEMTTIRKHPAANEIMDEVCDAIRLARRTIDRPANRTIIFVGPCPEVDENGADCPGDVYAFIPTEDDRPGRMQCGTNGVHTWASIQWYSTGKRILKVMRERKRKLRKIA